MITYPYIRGEELYIPVKTELEPKVVILSGKRGKVSLQIPWCKPEDADYIVKYLPDPAQQFYEITADDGFFQNLTEKRENLRIQHEPFPQIHFHPDTGWMNDPNGLFYINGEWNMFFQYNPFSAKWQNMHWKHAVSRDLIHWHEKEITLYPDEFGTMYSGSAVVDINNDSGLGTQNGVPPILLFYT